MRFLRTPQSEHVHEMEDFTLVLESLDLQLMKAFYRFLISSKIKKIQII